MKPYKAIDPKPVLDPGALYLGDNGRCFCGACAGTSAKYTGRDISGQKVARIDFDALVQWRAEMGDSNHDPKCEDCGKAVRS